MDKRALSFILCAVVVLLLVRHSFSRSQPLDTRDWGLVDFIDHLRAMGLQVHVVPVNETGPWGNTVYLSEDPTATWHSFQHKHRSVEHIEQWQGVVWIEHLRTQEDTEWDIASWGRNGCQMGRFVLFGDARLLERIVQLCSR